MRKTCRACGVEKSVEEFSPSPEGNLGRHSYCRSCYNMRYNARYQLRRRYGMTVEDYNRMLAAQGGCCSICGATDPGGRNKRFCVDHDHDTGRVRALVCHSCNLLVGWLEKKGRPTLKQALNYLDRHALIGRIEALLNGEERRLEAA